MLPDLFREGQGVVAEGALDGRRCSGRHVLAKHDENYMPNEVAEALKKPGHWKDDYAPTGARCRSQEPAMIAELGHYALVLALGLALIQASMPIIGARSDDPR